jgi:hypothetical protein
MIKEDEKQDLANQNKVLLGQSLCNSKKGVLLGT